MQTVRRVVEPGARWMRTPIGILHHRSPKSLKIDYGQNLVAIEIF